MENRIIDYFAKAGPGLVFPSKTYILQDTSSIYIISPSVFNPQLIDEIKSLQKAIKVIAPNNFHNNHLALAKEVFPEAEFYGPKRSAKQSGIELKNTIELSSNEIDFIKIEGCNALSETCFFHKTSKTLFVTDLFFNMHHDMNLPMKMILKMVGGYHRLATSKSVRLMTKDKEKFKQSVSCLVALKPERIVPAHGNEINYSEFKAWAEALT